MLKRRPARLRARITLVFALHAAAMVVVMLLSLIHDGQVPPAPFYRLPEPPKVALIATAFEHTPTATHADLVRAFSDTTQQVELLDMLPAPGPQVSDGADALSYTQALGGRPFRIQSFGPLPPEDFVDRPLLSHAIVQVVVALPDGHALAIRHTTMPPVTNLLMHSRWLLVAIVLIDALVILWLASLTTRPLEQLARAVHDDRLDQLKLDGPREIRQLAEGFQKLQARLQSLVLERTRTLAAIAHDYRTYLTRLQLRTEFIDDPHQRALAVQDIDEMTLLLNDTLTFAREAARDDDQIATCDLHAELPLILSQRHERGDQVRLTGLDGPLIAQVSSLALRRMMANLLDNAMRYGGGQATITVSSGRVTSGDGTISIMIDDQGPGVPDDSLERLLQPFERLEPSRARETGGVGLGLSIVQALARRHHGDLILTNRPEGGFRARLSLRQPIPLER